MTDQAPASGEPPKGKSWLKTIIGTAAGLMSGAVLMYLTPLLDRVVKPAKPVANFGYEADGLIVTFHNRSTGGASGWWDFGDGSPLEPVTPEQQIVPHAYARPGDYTVKLALRNLIGEEHERTVLVKVEPPRTEPPTIAALDVLPISPGSYAPATFRLASRASNAQLFIWDYGDDRPLDIGTDKDHGHEKTVTFEKPGAYVVKLAAVNGTQATVKSDIVQVNVPPAGAVTAVLNVHDEATRVQTEATTCTFTDAFPPGHRADTHRINKHVPAKPGFAIADVQVKTTNQTLRLQGKSEMAIDPALLGIRHARDLRLQVAADRRSVRLTGELVRDGGKKHVPTLSLPVILIQEKREPKKQAAPPVMAALTVPGSALLTMPSLPADWVEPSRQPRVELREGDKVVWRDSQMARSALVKVQNKQCIVTASNPASGQVRIDLVELPPGLVPGLVPSGN